MINGAVAPSARSVCIVTTGCVECVMDANFLEHYFGARHQLCLAANFQEADFIILLGCAFNDHSEHYTREVIDFLRANKRAEAELLVMGCISVIRPELGTTPEKTSLPILDMKDALRHDTSVNSMVSLSPARPSDESLFGLIRQTREKAFLPESPLARLCPGVTRAIFQALAKFKNLTSISAFNDRTALLRLSMGCMANCSFCAIKTARGRVISKPPQNILEEFRRLLDQGYRDIALVGTNIGDYGKDVRADLLDVLEPMVATPGDFRLRLRNLNPRWLIRRQQPFREMLTSGKIIFIHSAMQSANDRILRLMNRGYRAQEFLDCIRGIRSACPQVILKTDIMVGFPTETEAEFQDSFQVVRKKVFHHAVIMRYTDRPNTKASTIEPKVPESVTMARYRRIVLTELFNQPLRKAWALYRLNHQRQRWKTAVAMPAPADGPALAVPKPSASCGLKE